MFRIFGTTEAARICPSKTSCVAATGNTIAGAINFFSSKLAQMSRITKHKIAIRVLVVDDHALIRKGLRQILDDTGDIQVVAEAENGMEAINLVRDHDYGVVLLDITLPDKYGIDVLKQLKALRPGLPVLVLSIHPEVEYAMRSIKAGAAGYMSKQSAPSQLVSAIRQVASGKKYISSTLAEQLANEFIKPGNQVQPHQVLSNREHQTLCLMASGKSLSEMADIMSLSAKTVSVYRARMMEKMGFRNNADAVRYAVNNHLIE
jgi:two-component system invasion response regulator UvrY